jgi:LacI family transcriptional regulator
MNNSKLISEETRRKVEQAIAETGYVYNRNAASLRSQKSNIIGLLISDIKNPFYAEVLRGVEYVIDRENYSLLIGSTSDLADKQSKLVSAMLEQGIDGLLFSPSAGTSTDMIKPIAASNVPFVFIARSIPDVKADYVGVDYFIGIRKVMEHLILNGHREIAFINYYKKSSISEERLSAFCEVADDYGLAFRKDMVLDCMMNLDAAKKAAIELMSRSAKPTAIICYNDIIACGATMGLSSMGIKVGNEGIAVVGADDMDIATYWTPKISTTSSRSYEVGKLATQILLERINNRDEPVKKLLLTPELIIRESG